MLTAHLPSGYVLARLMPESHRLLLPAALDLCSGTGYLGAGLVPMA
ncbi:hypothetical protein [Phaeobacter gallaeciensis]|nr:hypothetical protein [Phaeobacter gallaeciensis]